jgi:hypothetical protein
MRIAVLAVGTPAEVQSLIALAEELARRRQLSVQTCMDGASTLAAGAQDSPLHSWLHAVERTSESQVATQTDLVLRFLETTPEARVLELAHDGSWFLWQERRIDLRARRVLARILASLARMRVDCPGEPLTIAQIVAEAWPNEQMQRKSANNRVRVALSTLRGLGLRDVLCSLPAGILIDPAVELVRRAKPATGARDTATERTLPARHSAG